jgi:hypothetical protein
MTRYHGSHGITRDVSGTMESMQLYVMVEHQQWARVGVNTFHHQSQLLKMNKNHSTE